MPIDRAALGKSSRVMRVCVFVMLSLFSRMALAEPDSFLFGDGGSGALTVSTGGVVVNAYVALANDAPAGTTQLFPASTAGFAPGQLVLLLQSKDDFGDAGFPLVVDLGPTRAGAFEFARLASISSTMALTAPLTRAFVGGRTQIIRVPEYTSLTVTSSGSITAPAFDGYTGGVIVVLADSVTNDGVISVTGLGYAGGAPLFQTAGPTGCSGLEEPPPAGSPRGAGPDVLAVSITGRGGTPGGGGGGACENGGGGGGAHFKNGGHGGGNILGANNGAEGGRALAYTPLSRLVFGGGGGTGWTQSQMPVGGGRGGGVAWVRARSISGAGVFSADGSNSPIPVTYGVGGSGAGAGGTVILQAQSDLHCALASAQGGSATLRVFYGPGGGGAGGLVVIQGSTRTCSVSSTSGVSVLNAYDSFNGATPVSASDAAFAGVTVEIANGLAAPPVPTIDAPSNGAVVSTRAPTVSGTALPDLGVVMYAQGVELTRSVADSTGAYAMTAPTAVPTGFVRLEVAAVNASGVMSGRAGVVVNVVVPVSDAGSPPLDAGSFVDGGLLVDAGVPMVDAGQAPRFLSTASTVATCGVAYRYGADVAPAVSGSGPMHFSLEALFGVAAPAGVTVDEATGTFSWTPTSEQRGFHLISLRVTNAEGYADQTFRVAVECIDKAPQKVGCDCGSTSGLLWGALCALFAATKTRRARLLTARSR